MFAHVGVDPRIDYTAQDFPVPFRGWEMASARMYATRSVTPLLVRRVLEDAASAFRSATSRATPSPPRPRSRTACGSSSVDRDRGARLPQPVFIRNKGAYLVGRARRENDSLPLVIAILNGEDGLTVDAVVRNENEISIIWSFARWYFHADLASPRQVIGFLHSILPRKRISELYLSLGYNKHGKTEFYRDLTSYAAASDESFVVAPGQRGLVMSVFTLPSYEFVFKVIRDTFPRPRPPPASASWSATARSWCTTASAGWSTSRSSSTSSSRASSSRPSCSTSSRRGVAQRRHRGRRRRDPPPLRRAPRNPARRVLQERDVAEREAAIVDWGRAVKELAAANIFPGDMLAKNFGVTRHGRVVFYDYDELCALDDCQFRVFPASRTDDEELQPEPWFSVRDGDVFPRSSSASSASTTGSIAYSAATTASCSRSASGATCRRAIARGRSSTSSLRRVEGGRQRRFRAFRLERAGPSPPRRRRDGSGETVGERPKRAVNA